MSYQEEVLSLSLREQMLFLAIKDKSKKDCTIIIDPSQSWCGACGGPATPNERSHVTRLPGYVKDPKPSKGCGAKWQYVSSNYVGLDLKAKYALQFPHLEWNGYDEQVIGGSDGNG